MKKLRALSFAGLLIAATYILVVTPISLHATYPGENGRLTFVSNLSGTYQLYTMNPDGSDMRQITNLSPTENTVWAPDYSPDGKKIVFSHDMTGALELYTINADGTGLTQVTHDGQVDLFARWSPDGQRRKWLGEIVSDGGKSSRRMRSGVTGYPWLAKSRNKRRR